MQAFDLKHLTIITTAACNLNCKYCTIAKNKTDTSSLLHKNTVQALKDGTYLENVKKVYQKLNLATAQVETLDFWGQEPTLSLEYITINLSNWLKTFPNLKQILFSTNGVAHTDKIIDFIKELDKVIHHKITLDIQISWDGKLSTEEYRQADSDVILKNTQYLIDEINKIKLNHVHINLQMHGVLSRNLIDELNTIEKVQKYFIDSNAEVNKIVDSCYNKNVHFAPLLGLGYENPVPASTQDGLDFYRFFRAGLTTNPDFFAKDQRDSVLIQPLIDLTRMMDAHLLKKDYFENILDLLDNTTDLGRIEHELNCLSQQLLCGAFASELKIMYDGTIISCQNHMFGLKSEDIKEDNSVENQVKKYLADKNYYMNPLADDFKMEDFENWREAFIIGKTNSFLYTFQQTVALMYYLSLARQIRPDYASNFKKLILHAFIITPVRQCPYNVYITTGSLYNKDTGLLRWYCNGILDEVEDYMNLQREKGAQPDGIR